MFGDLMSLATTEFEGQMIDLPVSVRTCEAAYQGRFLRQTIRAEYSGGIFRRIFEHVSCIIIYVYSTASNIRSYQQSMQRDGSA